MNQRKRGNILSVPEERKGIWNEGGGVKKRKSSNIGGGGEIMKKTAENFIRVACALASFRNVHL